MRILEKVYCKPEGRATTAIRSLLCIEAAREKDGQYNPLKETEFNSLLDEIVQDAFDAGRYFENKKTA